MKKIFVLFLAIFVMACFSVPVFATSSGTNDTDELLMGPTSGYSTTVKLSMNVIASYKTGGTSGTSYSATTYNPKGTGKAYGAASDTTYITYEPWTNTAAAPTLDEGNVADVTSGSWKQIGE